MKEAINTVTIEKYAEEKKQALPWVNRRALNIVQTLRQIYISVVVRVRGKRE